MVCALLPGEQRGQERTPQYQFPIWVLRILAEQILGHVVHYEFDRKVSK